MSGLLDNSILRSCTCSRIIFDKFKQPTNNYLEERGKELGITTRLPAVLL